MKKRLSVLMICLFFIIACATANQKIQSLTPSYDGIWEGYTDTPGGRLEIRMEIKDGIMSGFVEDTKIRGYIESDDNFIISPFSMMGAQVYVAANFMSPDRIEGTVTAPDSIPKWFVVKTATPN